VAWLSDRFDAQAGRPLRSLRLQAGDDADGASLAGSLAGSAKMGDSARSLRSYGIDSRYGNGKSAGSAAAPDAAAADARAEDRGGVGSGDGAAALVGERGVAR